ncbi:hypothetical protein [Micromonospora sp. DT4]|uniref:hypothetical protein n=1 Tax=Micromonospora sp. DT4 TaxID=3393438 RepID=UPI003CF20421
MTIFIAFSETDGGHRAKVAHSAALRQYVFSQRQRHDHALSRLSPIWSNHYRADGHSWQERLQGQDRPTV